MKKENLIFVEEAFRHKVVVDLVRKASERIWHKVPDVTVFEYKCYKDIGKALSQGEFKSVAGLADFYIRRNEAWYTKVTKYKPPKSLDKPCGVDEDGNEEIIEVLDVLANVEQTIIEKEIEKEKVALLAQGDNRKMRIINAWLNGMTNDLELSDVLAEEFGGKSSGQRRYIQRFREQCQKRLADAV